MKFIINKAQSYVFVIFFISILSACAKNNGNSSSSDLDDPLFSEAWHLVNTGQTAFSSGGGTAGYDLNLSTTIAEGYKGSGIKIAVSDNGTQIAHEDLEAQIIAGASKNYISESSPWIGDPTPSAAAVSATPSLAHGTAVAGIIGATGWNGKGSRGVAPEASLAGFRFVGVDESSESFTTILVDQANGDFDIFNYSYGYPSCAFQPINTSLRTQLQWGTSNLRGGKGAIYVKAAGNEYVSSVQDCTGDAADAITPYAGNSALDDINSQYQVIVAAALTATGVSANYSSAGANIWVSAPGGEFGTDSPAIVSTDYTSCSHGFSRSSNGSNSFESGSNSLNSNCNYTSTMNGTSSAAPNVSGAVALLLSAQPELTWRDIKYILAKTANRVYPASGNTIHPISGENLPGHVYQQGWVKNAADIYFHNWYGFGAVDVDAAVTMAKTYTSALGTLESPEVDSGTISVAIPDHSKNGVTSTLNATDSLKIESVEIYFSVMHPKVSDLGVELTSPSETKSILMNINSQILDVNLTNAHLITNAFLDEVSDGTWTLKIIDGKASNEGTLTNWKLKINGHATIIANKKGTPFEKAPLFTLFDALKFYFTAS